MIIIFLSHIALLPLFLRIFLHVFFKKNLYRYPRYFFPPGRRWFSNAFLGRVGWEELTMLSHRRCFSMMGVYLLFPPLQFLFLFSSLSHTNGVEKWVFSPSDII